MLNRPIRYITHGPELADGLDGVLALLNQLHDESMAIFRSLTPEALERKERDAGGHGHDEVEMVADDGGA